MDKNAVATELIKFCRLLNQKNMLAAADGNLSCRLPGKTILITPSARNKALLDESEIAEMDHDGNALTGEPSSEKWMHLEIYRLCPEAKCIVHAHPPTAVAWSIARPELRELPFEALPEVILATGRVPIVPYTIPGTKEMGQVLQPYLKSKPPLRVMILARHGAVSWGESLEEAYNGIERVEHAAQILKSAQELGGLTSLSAEQLSVLRAMREKKGNVTL